MTYLLPSALRLACFRFDLEAMETLHLPPYKGSALRGGFGHIFKRIACTQTNLITCEDCMLRWKCSYSSLFESAPPPDGPVLRKNAQVPRPFVIEPPLDSRTEIPEGERLSFKLVLVGKAIDYLPYFLVSFRDLGSNGIGARRGSYNLSRVSSRHPYTRVEYVIYDGRGLLVQEGDQLQETDATDISNRATQLPTDKLTIHFRTPTLIMHRGSKEHKSVPVKERLGFSTLIRALLGRISTLLAYHCDYVWEVDFKGLVEQASEVQLVDCDLQEASWQRYSSHQDRKLKMEGFVGRATYQGALEPYLPLLAAGELLHVGKATVFGQGLYQLQSL